jgi:signaling intermediate in Toll pathway protein
MINIYTIKTVFPYLKTKYSFVPLRSISVSYPKFKKKSKEEVAEEKAIIVKENLFHALEKKDKETFHEALQFYVDQSGKHRRGHVEFIYAALNHVKDFGVHQDVETYKKLLDLFPKGVMIPQTVIAREFQHYPKQQQCAIDVLDKMEQEGVVPDKEMWDILMNTFGSYSFAIRKYMRMMYWMPKFLHASPWPLPKIMPKDAMVIARLALERMTAVDLKTRITFYQTEDIPDSDENDIWIGSAQSPVQQALLEEHPTDVPLYVEGPHRIYLRDTSIHYFVLKAEATTQPPPPTPEDPDDVSQLPVVYFDPKDGERQCPVEKSVHEQEDGTVMAICVTETSSPASLSAWLYFLQQTNPALEKLNIVFALKQMPVETHMVPTDNEEVRKIT